MSNISSGLILLFFDFSLQLFTSPKLFLDFKESQKSGLTYCLCKLRCSSLIPCMVSFDYNLMTCYKFLSLVEITAFRQERIFQPMRALEFITGHGVYNPTCNLILQAKDENLYDQTQSCKNISLWQPSIRHRPADVLSNTHSQLSAVSHPGGVKWKICGKIAIGYGNGKKQFPFSVIERFFLSPWLTLFVP